MLHTISQGGLAVTVTEHGGRLTSMVYNGEEYLTARVPDGQAAAGDYFFPIIGAVPGDAYRVNGTKYKLKDPKGLLRGAMFRVEQEDYEHISLILRSDEKTKKQYPFDFLYRIQYRVIGNRLAITSEVENHSMQSMYFSVGNQLQLNVPFGKHRSVNEYGLEFPTNCVPLLYDVAEDGFSRGSIVYKLVGDRRLPFDQALFTTGKTKFFTQVPSAVFVKNRRSTKGVRFSFYDMQYVGLFCEMDGARPCVSLLFSTAVPQKKGPVMELSGYEGITTLEPGRSYVNESSITID